MNPLQRLEKDFQEYVHRPGPGMAQQVMGTAKAGAGERLEIYADAYRLRLLEVLGNDFPGLKQLAGDATFERLSRDYIEAQPSSHFNLRWYGEQLPRFLQEEARWHQQPAFAEMGAFEWAMGLAFDAPDERAAAVNDMAAVPSESWPGMVAVPQSGLRHLQLQFNVPDIRKAVDQDAGIPALSQQATKVGWLVWRQELMVYFRRLDDPENRAVTSLLDGTDFAQICEELCEWHTPEAAAGKAASLLKRWLTDGLIRDIRY